jgi:stage V sporulation protein SpoVS
VGDLINKAFAGSGKDLILAALRGHVSERERAEIQAILAREK